MILCGWTLGKREGNMRDGNMRDQVGGVEGRELKETTGKAETCFNGNFQESTRLTSAATSSKSRYRA